MCMGVVTVIDPAASALTTFDDTDFREIGQSNNEVALIFEARDLKSITFVVTNNDDGAATCNFRILGTHYNGTLQPEEIVETATDEGQFITTIQKVAGSELVWHLVYDNTAAKIDAGGNTEIKTITDAFTHYRLQMVASAAVTVGEFIASIAGITCH